MSVIIEHVLTGARDLVHAPTLNPPQHYQSQFMLDLCFKGSRSIGGGSGIRLHPESNYFSLLGGKNPVWKILDPPLVPPFQTRYSS